MVGAFYRYTFEFGGDPEYGHNALARLLEKPHVDFVMVTASYHIRELGSGADCARASITSVALHGKLWHFDNDTVSFRYDEMHRDRTDRETVARHRRELGVTETPEETIWQYRRAAGFVLGSGIYQSFFDLHGGYFDDPRLMAEVRRLRSLLDASKDRDCSSVAELLVVSDGASCSYATFENPFLDTASRGTQVSLAELGAPHDSILIDDLERLDLRPYRFVMFLACFHLTAKQSPAIRERILGAGRTVLWCCAPGLFEGSKRSWDRLRELAGMRIVPSAARGLLQPRIRLVPGSHPAVDEAIRGGAATIGSPNVWAECLEVDDPSAIALGRREGGSELVLAAKKLGDWTSICALQPALPPPFFRTLARPASTSTTTGTTPYMRAAGT